MLKGHNSLVYTMLLELVCYFHIGIHITGSKRAFVWYKKWAENFFVNLDKQGPLVVNGPPLIEKLKKRLEQFTISSA